MKTIEAYIVELESLLQKATPLPWEFGANIPFYVNISKPAPSLSKHDEKCPTYWRYEDGLYASAAVHALPKLLAVIKELSGTLKYEAKNHEEQTDGWYSCPLAPNFIEQSNEGTPGQCNCSAQRAQNSLHRATEILKKP